MWNYRYIYIHSHVLSHTFGFHVNSGNRTSSLSFTLQRRNTIVPLETNLFLDVFEPACWNLTIISRKFFSKNLAKGSMGGGVGWGLI